MEIFEHAAVIWFVIGFVLLMLEFAVPGFILFFFAVGAWILGLLLLLTDMPVNVQLLLFIGISVLAILLFRKSLRRIMGRKHAGNLLEDEFIGKTGIAETAIAPGMNGKVSFKGTSWDARSDVPIGPGENVLITGTDSIVLIVTSTKDRL